MKNSLKLMISMLIVAVFSIGNAFAGQCGPEGCKGQEQQDNARFVISDNLLKNNGQVAPYVPKNLKGTAGMSIPCDENGTLIHSGKKDGAFVLGRCYDYKSGGSDSWRIRYSNSAADKSVRGNDVIATQVFKIVNGRLDLYASFNGQRTNTYASSEAQKFASKQGSGNTTVAKEDESATGDIIKDAQNGDAGELIKKGIGIMKGFKF